MRLVLTLESRFQRTPDGAVWSPSITGQLWERYLAVFDHLRVVARVEEVATMEQDAHVVSGSGVSFWPVPHYQGPRGYLRRVWQIEQAIRGAVGPGDAVIMRIPSQIAGRLVPRLRHRGRPYGVEVVGDPADVFAPRVIDHPLRPALRWHFSRQVRRQCADAAAVAYVTQRALQQRYPADRTAFTIACSDVELDDAAFRRQPRVFAAADRRWSLVAVGSLDQRYKGPDVLLDALAAGTGAGLDLGLTWVGGGRLQTDFERQADGLGLRDRVRWRGQLPAGAAVQTELDAADLFVLPSRTEGLPRAMIEAMARGLPCIGTTVGGVPELLPDGDLVPPGDASALAAKIAQVLGDPARLEMMAERNGETARGYHAAVLGARRERFYRELRNRTERWIRERGR